MKYLIIIITALFVFVEVDANAQHSQLLDSALQSYSVNNFEKAIVAYEDVLKNGFESAELYYNLGNAYYKSNQIPFAILNYERAKNLSSSDEDIEFNLRLANTHIVDKIDVLPEFFLLSWWDNLVQILSSNHWAILSMSTFVLGLVTLLTFFLSRITIARKASFWLGVLLITVSVFTFNFSRKQYWLANNEPKAIIITPSIVVKSSPSDNGTELFLIHEGLKVTVTETDKSGKWKEIRLSDGNEGWIKESDVVEI